MLRKVKGGGNLDARSGTWERRHLVIGLLSLRPNKGGGVGGGGRGVTRKDQTGKKAPADRGGKL